MREAAVVGQTGAAETGIETETSSQGRDTGAARVGVAGAEVGVEAVAGAAVGQTTGRGPHVTAGGIGMVLIATDAAEVTQGLGMGAAARMVSVTGAVIVTGRVTTSGAVVSSTSRMLTATHNPAAVNWVRTEGAGRAATGATAAAMHQLLRQGRKVGPGHMARLQAQVMGGAQQQQEQEQEGLQVAQGASWW
jgi:hypothetical protein